MNVRVDISFEKDLWKLKDDELLMKVFDKQHGEEIYKYFPNVNSLLEI